MFSLFQKFHKNVSRVNYLLLFGFCINILLCQFVIAQSQSSFNASDSANIEQIEGLVNDLRLHLVNVAPQADISVDGTIWHHVWNIDSQTQDILDIINKKYGTNQENFPFYIYQIFNAINSFKTSFDDFSGPNGFIPSIYNTELSIDSTLKSSNTKLDNILSSTDSVKVAIDNWQDNYLQLFQVINEYLPKIEDRETRASILEKVDEINNYIPSINSFLGEISTTTELSQSSLQSIYNLLNSHLGSGLTEDISQIADDISVIRNTQLSYIYSQVGSIASNSKYFRDNWDSKLDNLDIIAKALSGISSDGSSPNLGFESIGKNVELLTDTSLGISNEVSRLSSAIRKAEGLSYMLVSNIAYNSSSVYTNIFTITNSPLSALDLSIITNAILGSAFIGPFNFEWGQSYYDLLEQYKNGEIEPEIFIAEMGLYNWFAGLNFGDWWVDAPESEDTENMERWGIVDQAKLLWSPLVESTSFPPYETSNARYFLYGTRDLTDNSTNLVYLSDIEKNTVSNAFLLSKIALNTASNALYLSKINNNTMSNTYYLSRSYQVAVSNMNLVSSIYNLLQEWNDDSEPTESASFPSTIDTEFEEVPEELSKDIPEVTDLLNMSQPDDGISDVISTISKVENLLKDTSLDSSSSAPTFNFNFALGPLNIKKSITIKQLEGFSSIWEKTTNFITWGFKIAVSLMVLAASIKVTYTEMKEMPLWYS